MSAGIATTASKRAVVTGVNGQDGWFVARDLQAAGYDVFGLSIEGDAVPDLPGVAMLPATDIRDVEAVRRAIITCTPDAVIHLAAKSHIGSSWTDLATTTAVNATGTANVIQTAIEQNPDVRIILASTSEIFGQPAVSPQDERTPIAPSTPYGASKAFGNHLARQLREHDDRFICNAILYNHESWRRPPTFVTAKIVQGARDIAEGRERTLALGNLESRRDWGYAGDVSDALVRMLAMPAPEDLVIATGTIHTVRDWCELAFAAHGLGYESYVEMDATLWQPVDPIPLCGDISRAKDVLHWAPRVGFEELVHSMVEQRPAVAAPDMADPCAS